MTRERLYLFDTTLRDGQQTQGVQFSTPEKVEIARALDALGLDYIEGGWPGANPTDTRFFAERPETRATFTAFGMTKRAGRSADNDEVLALVRNAGTPAVCLVGKSHDFHVTHALGIELPENLVNIRESIARLVADGREALFDAEHFFDGWKANRAYALDCLHAARDAGARWIVLCDTNGGTLPDEIGRIVADVIASGIPGTHVGIHTHDDTGTAVAGSLAAVEAGARQIQGTLNGLGERCGNANLTTLIPTLLLKEPYASRFGIGVTPDHLAQLTRTSRRLDDILNRVPVRSAPYVGASAFAHKAGLHASAVVKDPTLYEHVAPQAVGNRRVIPMSNQAGRANLLRRLAELGLPADRDDSRVTEVLDRTKALEDEGYEFDSAQASQDLVLLRAFGPRRHYFEVERYRVISERRRNARGALVVESEAVVTITVQGQHRTEYFKNEHAQELQDDGPVNALWQALRRAFGPLQPMIDDIHLTDFRVRITQAGTEARTRVIIDFADGNERQWSTVGVSSNIVDAAFIALTEAISWKLTMADVEEAAE